MLWTLRINPGGVSAIAIKQSSMILPWSADIALQDGFQTCQLLIHTNGGGRLVTDAHRTWWWCLHVKRDLIQISKLKNGLQDLAIQQDCLIFSLQIVAHSQLQDFEVRSVLCKCLDCSSTMVVHSRGGMLCRSDINMYLDKQSEGEHREVTFLQFLIDEGPEC